jgi:hypothetical protein
MLKIVAGTLLTLLCAAGFGEEIKLQNPSFEQGTGGYWINKPASAAIDADTSAQGAQSLCLQPPVNVVQFIEMHPGEIYHFSFDSKGELEKDGPTIQLTLMLQGKKPVMFWLPDNRSKSDFEFTPATKWTRREFVFGPVPAQAQGQEVTRIGLFINAVTGAKPGKVWIDNLQVTTESAPETAEKKIAAKAVENKTETQAAEKKTGTKTAESNVRNKQLELKNPSFENGTDGYWIDLPSATQIDPGTGTQGSQSLCLTPPKIVSVVQFVPLKPDTIYRFSFDSKGELEKEGPKIQLALMLQGKKPVMFWLPDDRSQSDFEFTPATKWTRREFVFGPVPAQAQGQDVNNIGLYINAVAGTKPGKVWIDNLQISTEKAAPEKEAAKKKSAVEPLTIELSGPVQIYEHPTPVKLTAAGAPAGASIAMEITDVHGKSFLTRSGTADTALQAELSNPGYYCINASMIQSGRILNKKSTSLLITTPLPPDYYSTPEPAFGVWGGLTPELLRLGGAKWTRELFFTLFQKKDLVAAAPAAEQLQQRSPVKVIRCLNILNPFKKMVPVPAADWPEIREKVTKELISHQGLADVWETQNEPMVGENFHGTMQDVVDIMVNTSELVRRNTPGVPLAGICINPMSLNQYGQITGYYRNFNIIRYIDAVMLHPYIPNAASPDTSGYVETLSRLERDLRDITGKDVPLYISEIGYSTKPGGEVTELQQAAYLARVVLLNRRIKNLRACVWHIGLWNDATSPRELDYGILRGHQKNSLIREPKPAFAAWATVSRQTYNADYIGDIEFGRGVRVLLFSRQGKPLLAAYSLSARPQQLKIPLGGAKAIITGVCGTVTEQPLEKGIIDLTVDEAPVYIAGSDPDDVRRLTGLKVEFSPEIFKANPGGRMTAVMNGAPLARPGAALRVEVPAGWTAKVEGGGTRRSVTVEVPVEARPGETTLFFHLVENGESRNIWRREFQILPPVELRDVKLQTSAAGGTELAFTPSGTVNDPHMQLKVREDDKIMATAEIEVNRPAHIALPPPAFGRPHQYTAEITLDRKYSWQEPLPALNRFPLAKVEASTPLSSWPATASFELSGGEYSRHSIEGEFDRPEGKLYLGWSRESMLLRLVCRDRWQITAEQPESMWQGDSLQIGFCVPQEEMIRPNNDGIQETSFTEFGLMPAADGQCRSLVWSSTNRTLSELGKPLTGIKASWQRKGEFITYRIDIPWQSLNVKNPRPGMPVKLSLLINDCDSIAGKRYQRHWLEWYSGIADGKNPELYGSGVLKE